MYRHSFIYSSVHSSVHSSPITIELLLVNCSDILKQSDSMVRKHCVRNSLHLDTFLSQDANERKNNFLV